MRGVRVFRTLFYLPSLVPAVASSLLWLWGVKLRKRPVELWPYSARAAALAAPHWLEDPNWTLSAFIMMSLWGVGGARMIIFLAGLQGINESYYEAASLTGQASGSSSDLSRCLC